MPMMRRTSPVMPPPGAEGDAYSLVRTSPVIAEFAPAARAALHRRFTFRIRDGLRDPGTLHRRDGSTIETSILLTCTAVPALNYVAMSQLVFRGPDKAQG
jgi:hypothetical protein